MQARAGWKGGKGGKEYDGGNVSRNGMIVAGRGMWYNESTMKKLIVKCQLTNREKFVWRLGSLGMKLSPAVWQHERVYVARDYRPHMNYPRLMLRTEVQAADQPARYALRLKRHIEDSGVDWVNSTLVGDYTEATMIIHQLGYRKLTEVSRQREELVLNENTVIYLDTLEGVERPFLKVEVELNDEMSVEAMRNELFTTLKLLEQETFLLQTYAELMVEQMQPYYLPR